MGMGRKGKELVGDLAEKSRAERREEQGTHSMGLRAWQGMALRRVDSQTICWNKFEIEWNCQKHFAHFATASDAKKKPRKKKQAKLFLLLPFPSPCPCLPCTWRKFVAASLLIPLHASGIFALLCTRVSYGFNKAKPRNSCRCVMKSIKYLIKIFTMQWSNIN